MFVLKVIVATVAFGLVQVELGAEFFIALNTALNLATLMYVNKTRTDIKPKVERVEQVAKQLDTRVEGGQRAYDPPSPCDK